MRFYSWLAASIARISAAQSGIEMIEAPPSKVRGFFFSGWSSSSAAVVATATGKRGQRTLAFESGSTQHKARIRGPQYGPQ